MEVFIWLHLTRFLYTNERGEIMDIVTLAMTKPKVINLNDYGIDLATMVLGGGGNFSVYGNTPEMWDTIFRKTDKNLQFVARMGEYAFYLFPSVMTDSSVNFSLMSPMYTDDEYLMVRADIVMGEIRGGGEITGTNFSITVTQTPVPTCPTP